MGVRNSWSVKNKNEMGTWSLREGKAKFEGVAISRIKDDAIAMNELWSTRGCSS